MNLEYAGKSPFYSDYEIGAWRLLVAVVCFVEQIPDPIHALLDTGSEWCVLPPQVAIDLGFDLDTPEATIPLSTRFGLLYGRLERVWIRFAAAEGQPTEVQTTCFLSEMWPGPMVIGWKGCLQWMRFGCEPAEEAFYFGEP